MEHGKAQGWPTSLLPSNRRGELFDTPQSALLATDMLRALIIARCSQIYVNNSGTQRGGRDRSR